MKRFILKSALAVLLLGLIPSFAYADHRGSGRYYRGGYSHRGDYGHSNWGFSLGFGLPSYGRSYYYAPSYGSGYYPSYSNSYYPDDYVYVAPARPTYYYTPAPRYYYYERPYYGGVRYYYGR